MVVGPDEERYVRPPREYEIPPFREGTKHCTSNEKYLRPTRWCNPEPGVIAVANELGAYELSDWEFADAAFWFVKDNMSFEMVPLDGDGATMTRGKRERVTTSSPFLTLSVVPRGLRRGIRFFAMNYDNTPPDPAVPATPTPTPTASRPQLREPS